MIDLEALDKENWVELAVWADLELGLTAKELAAPEAPMAKEA